MNDDVFDKAIGDLQNDAVKRIHEGKDEGHNALIADLEDVLAEAKGLQFHDLLNEKYSAPKVALAQRFLDLRQNVINGRYDN